MGMWLESLRVCCQELELDQWLDLYLVLVKVPN